MVRIVSFIFVIVLGFGSAVYLTLISPFDAGDFQTYYHAGVNALSGTAFIGSSAPMPEGPYVYLPITVLLFIPFAFLPQWTVAYPLLIGVNVAGGVVLGLLLIRIIRDNGVDISKTDKVLVVSCIMISPIGVSNILQTQPNLWLAASIVAGYRYAQQGRSQIAGFLFAVPAIIKLWPALFGIWLLYNRDWRAVGTAIVTGVSAIIASVAVFGIDRNVRYFEYILTARSWTAQFAGGVDPNFGIVTVRRPISVVASGLDPSIMAFIGFGICGGILSGFYWLDTTIDGNPFIPFGVTLTIITIAFPAISPYMVFVLVLSIFLIYLENRFYYISALSASMILIVSIFQPDNIIAVANLLAVSTDIIQAFEQIIISILQYGSIPLYGISILLSIILLMYNPILYINQAE